MQNSAFILFGASGDLAKQKIFVSIENIKKRGEWPKNLRVITYSRKEPHVRHNYIKGDFEDFTDLNKYIEDNKIKELFFYFALPPSLYYAIIEKIFNVFHIKQIHIALEKPFGNSYEEAKKLYALIQRHGIKKFYLVDHYLGKEPLMDLSSRFNLKVIKNIEVAMNDMQNLESRGRFYDTVGEIKDTGQNHILLMIASVFGKKFDAKKLKYIPKSLVVKQFKGYRENDGVDPKSNTETYFEAKFKYEQIDIKVRSGKAMKTKSTQVKINNDSINVNVKQTKDPHEYILGDFVNKTSKFSLSPKQAMYFWKITNPILEDKQRARIKYYSKQSF